MKPHTLKLSLVLALSLATLAACDKHHKKSDEATDTTNATAAAPATTPTTTPAPSTTTAAPAPATAEAGGGKRAWKAACADDLKKFCADADKPGRCLKEHESEISQGCKTAREEAKAAHKAEKAEKGE